jgi:sec-independent protein translocase protein TatA
MGLTRRNSNMFYSKPWADVLIVLLIVVLFFGPKRLPQLGRSLGQGLKEFKDGITGGHSEEEEERPALTQAASAEQPSAADKPAAVAAEQAPPTPAPAQRESAEVGSSEQRP